MTNHLNCETLIFNACRTGNLANLRMLPGACISIHSLRIKSRATFALQVWIEIDSKLAQSKLCTNLNESEDLQSGFSECFIYLYGSQEYWDK